MAKKGKKRKGTNMIAGAFNELRQVQWTPPKELLNLVIFTVVVCALVAGIMVVMDEFFQEVVTRLLAL